MADEILRQQYEDTLRANAALEAQVAEQAQEIESVYELLAGANEDLLALRRERDAVIAAYYAFRDTDDLEALEWAIEEAKEAE